MAVVNLAQICSFVVFLKLNMCASHRIVNTFDNSTLDPLVNMWVSTHFPTAVSLNVSEECKSHTQMYLTAYRKKHPSALKMFESSGRLKGDLLSTLSSRNIYHESGLFDECISTEWTSDLPFDGKYCSVFFESVKNTPILRTVIREKDPDHDVAYFEMTSLGLCIPSTCSARDVRSSVAQQIESFTSQMTDSFEVDIVTSEDYCYTKEEITTIAKSDIFGIIIMLSMLTLLCFLVAWATLHEARNYKVADKLSSKLLHCFSLIRNGRQLLSTDTNVKEDIGCLHGIRVLSMAWIIFIHTSKDCQKYAYNQLAIQQKSLRWGAQAIANGSVAVDNFFLLGGLVVTYSQLNKLIKSNGKFNLSRFYLHRYIRLTPLYAMIVGLIATLYPYVGSGPDWNRVTKMGQFVKNYWWTYLMYINNHVPLPVLSKNHFNGIPETWYLACEMQMFSISPLFIYPLWRWKTCGLVWLVFATLLFLGSSVFIFTVFNIPMTILVSRMTDMSRVDEYFQLIYTPMYSRIPPYMIGIVLGWLLHNTKTHKFQINQFWLIIGWIVSGLTVLYVLFGLTPYLNEETVPLINPYLRIGYGSLHRSVWAGAVAWMIFACANGHGGFVNTFLSWKMFIPLGRLSYGVYLIHNNIIKAHTSQMRKPFYFTDIQVIFNALGITICSLMLASFLSLLVEIPFLNLDRLLLSDEKIKVKSS